MHVADGEHGLAIEREGRRLPRGDFDGDGHRPRA
jgi:hypothetical protein